MNAGRFYAERIAPPPGVDPGWRWVGGMTSGWRRDAGHLSARTFGDPESGFAFEVYGPRGEVLSRGAGESDEEVMGAADTLLG